MVLGLGRNLFSVPASLKQGVVTIFDSVQPRVEVGNVVVPLQKSSEAVALYSFSRDLAGKGDIMGVVLRVESTDLWQRRAGYMNVKRIDILRQVEGNGVVYNGNCRNAAFVPSAKAPNKLTLTGHLMLSSGPFSSSPPTIWDGVTLRW